MAWKLRTQRSKAQLITNAQDGNCCEQTAVKDIGSRSVVAVFWGGGGAIARIVLQFGTQVVLARLLGPEQYGLFAIGAIVVSFSNFFADIGIAYGLIQKSELADEDLRFVSTWQFLIGGTVSLVIALASTHIATFFGDPRSGPIVQGLAIICLVNAMAAPSLNMLKRKLDFKAIQVAQLTAYVVGYMAIGIPLALVGWQVWALVIAWLAQSTVLLVLLYAFVKHPIRPLIWFADAGQLAKYGATVLTTNLVNWLINNVDKVVVGRVFNSKDIGLYATSYNMLYNPTSSLLGVLQPVFFSASARLSDEQARIAAGYRSLVGAITLFILPAFVGLAVVSETFALALYGNAWQDLGHTLRPLALAMPLFLLWGMTTPLLWAGGGASSEFKSQLPLAIVWLGVAWLTAKVSVLAVAWSVFGLFACRFFVILRSAIRLLDISGRSLWLTARGGVLLSILAGAVLWVADQVQRFLLWPSMAQLAFNVVVGVITVIGTLWLIPALISPDLQPLIEKIAAKLPHPIASRLQRLHKR
ncbi:lipopolysaccharide biosynthesis protein [Rhodoferax sp.]|uniref:lipopolysaccharide biosynthesis protein n=1 Tax=Rhodoferax sp. TaxID=50421 RepID=UPI0025E76F7C|nr:lipopolysaccharide biosynthesis protein [Rhodoferax sp.]